MFAGDQNNHHYKVPASEKEVWNHGEIGENEAEDYLQNGHPGLFLVRNGGPNRFYISFVDVNGEVCHLPIRKINDSYFCLAQRFDSISETVEWFTSTNSDGEVCSSSSASFSNTSFLEKFLLIKTLTDSEGNQLRGRKGDVVSVMSRLEDGHVWGKNESNGAVGTVETTLLRQLVSDTNIIEDQPYFYNAIATEIVQPLPLGSFLVRRSSRGDDAFALLVKTQPDLVEKFLIVGTHQDGFLLAGRPFTSISQIVNRYCCKPISGRTRLTHAIVRETDEKNLVIHARRPSAPVIQIPPSFRLAKRGSLDISLQYTTHLADVPSPCKSQISPEDVLMEDEDEQQLQTTVDTSCQKLIAGTTALRKSREEKPWKECYVALYESRADRSSVLTVADSENSTKPRWSIDLSTFIMYWLDETVFGTDGTIFLSHAMAHQSSLFLCFRPANVFLEWANLIRNRTINTELGDSKDVNGNPKQLSILYLEIEKFRLEQLKSDAVYSVSALIDSVKMCSSPQLTITNSKSTNDVAVVVFGSKFVFPLIPATSTTLQLIASTHTAPGKKGRSIHTSPVLRIPDSGDFELASDIGFSLKGKRFRINCLPPSRYAPLLDHLREQPEALLARTVGVLPKHKLRFLHTTLVYLYISRPECMVDMLRKIFDEELGRSTAETLFRMDSLATGVVSQCLRTLLKGPLDGFLNGNQTFNSLLRQSNTEACAEKLMEFVSTTLQATHLALQMLSILAECAKRRFGDEGHLVRRTISILLVCRFINPTVLAAHPGSGHLAKLLQSAANTAASRVPLTELVSVALLTRNLFDKPLFYTCKKSGEEAKVEHGSSEWLAILSHLLACCPIEENEEVTPEIRYLISHHKSIAETPC